LLILSVEKRPPWAREVQSAGTLNVHSIVSSSVASGEIVLAELY